MNYALNLLCHHMGSTQSVGRHLIQVGHVPFAQLPDYAMLVLCPRLALPAQTDRHGADANTVSTVAQNLLVVFSGVHSLQLL